MSIGSTALRLLDNYCLRLLDYEYYYCSWFFKLDVTIQLIITLEDQGMVQEAADELVALPGIDNWFKGYKEDRPEQFLILTQHPTVSAKVKSLGL